MIKTIGIVGTGAVGGYYGCRSLEAGCEVRFLLRSEYEEVRKHGFTVHSVHGDYRVERPQIYRSAQEMGQVDLVIVAWKATANSFAQEVIAPLMHERTRILTLQNGLGNVELLERLFGVGRVLGGLCFACLNRLGGGVISHTAGGKVNIGEFHDSGILKDVPCLLGAKIPAHVVANLGEEQWRKLVWNIPFNGLCVTEGGINTEELLAREGMEEKIFALMSEVIEAAGLLGYEIPKSFAEEMIEMTRPMGAYKPSTLLDYVAGHEIEVEAIWGESLRRAQAKGARVPRMEKLYGELRDLAAQLKWTCHLFSERF